MFVVSVVCCQVEVSATSWSLVQRSPTDCDASFCVIKKLQEWGVKARAKGNKEHYWLSSNLSWYKSIYNKSCIFCVKNCDQVTWGQKVPLILWCVSENLQLNGAPLERRQWTPKHVGSTGWSKGLCAPDDYSTQHRCTENFWSFCIINTWSSVHRVVHKCWSVIGDLQILF